MLDIIGGLALVIIMLGLAIFGTAMGTLIIAVVGLLLLCGVFIILGTALFTVLGFLGKVIMACILVSILQRVFGKLLSTLPIPLLEDESLRGKISLWGAVIFSVWLCFVHW